MSIARNILKIIRLDEFYLEKERLEIIKKEIKALESKLKSKYGVIKLKTTKNDRSGVKIYITQAPFEFINWNVGSQNWASKSDSKAISIHDMIC
jgi:hypothetical protein